MSEIVLEEMKCEHCVHGLILDEFANTVSCPKCRGVGHMDYRITESQVMQIVEALNVCKLASMMSQEYWRDGTNTKEAVKLTSTHALSILVKE